MVSKRNGEIDVFRFVFSVIIVSFHFNSSFHFGFFEVGYIGVEFFFIVSGFLMARHVSMRNFDSNDLGIIADETWRYLLKKVKSFYAYYISGILLQILIRSIIVNHTSFFKIGYSFLKSIPTLTLTFMGLNRSTGLYLGNTWFLSSMLIAAFLLYPMLLRHYKFSVEIIFPFLSLFFLGYLMQTNNTITNWKEWSGFAYFGVLRAVAEMALGGSLFRLSEILAVNQPAILFSDKVLMKVMVTLFKYFCYAVVLVYSYGSFFGHKFKAGFDLHAMLFCALGVMLSFSNVGYCIPDNKVTRYLGKISLPIFIYHGFIKATIWNYIGHSISTHLFTMLIIMSIIVSVMLMYFTDFLLVKLKRATDKPNTSFEEQKTV